jgi:hypothetical protein
MSKVFVKNIENSLLPKEVKLVFENTKRYYDAAQSVKDLEMPEPLSYSDTEITFTFIDDLSPKVSELWFADQLWSTHLCNKLGTSLGSLHAAQGTDLSKEIYLYGDYVPHNVVYRDDMLIMFDVEPSMYRESFDEFYRGLNYVDIASMLFFMLVGHSYKKPWQFFRNKGHLVQSYLIGYSETSQFKIEKQQMILFLEKEFAFWYFNCDRRHGWFVKNLKYYFLKSVLLVQLQIYKIL